MGPAGEGQRKEHGGAGRATGGGPACEPPPRWPVHRGRPIFTPGRMHPTTTKPSQSETQPPSCPPSPLILPPATHLHTLSPLLTPSSIHPSARGRPLPQQASLHCLLCVRCLWGLGHSGRQTGPMSGQPELLQEATTRCTQRCCEAVRWALGSITGSVWVIKGGASVPEPAWFQAPARWTCLWTRLHRPGMLEGLL